MLFLQELYEAGRRFDAGESERANRKRNLDQESSALLHLLIRAQNPGKVLELGTSNGYSTIWIADALEGTGARFVTIDNDTCRAGQAADNLAATGLKKAVDQQIGEAADLLHGTRDSSVDLVFLDADRPAYTSYWPDLRRILADGGVLVVDSCVSHADEVAEFRALVESTKGFESVLVPIGTGLFIVFKER